MIATCFTHAASEVFIFHQSQQMFCKYGHTGFIGDGARIGKDDATLGFVVVPLALIGLGDGSFLRNGCEKRGLTVNHGIAKSHGINGDYGPSTGICFDLNHAKTL